MPELPDIVTYIEALDTRISGATLRQAFVDSPFLLRSAIPPLDSVNGRAVTGLKRIGKRIAILLEGQYALVIHLMIAGRLHWHAEPPKRSKRISLRIEFDRGWLTLTEAGSKKRASLHVIYGESDLVALDPGGLEVFGSTLDRFSDRLQRANHTLKRALTDPRIFSGIGNAYSDEILHRAQLSPVKLTLSLSADEISRLHQATLAVLSEWTDALRTANDEFPEKVTAFRAGMAVHGRYGKPCPTCGTSVQRIRYATNETNYCPRCQTDGRLLADRSLSRLLKRDWPRTIEELENRGREP